MSGWHGDSDVYRDVLATTTAPAASAATATTSVTASSAAGPASAAPIVFFLVSAHGKLLYGLPYKDHDQDDKSQINPNEIVA